MVDVISPRNYLYAYNGGCLAFPESAFGATSVAAADDTDVVDDDDGILKCATHLLPEIVIFATSRNRKNISNVVRVWFCVCFLLFVLTFGVYSEINYISSNTTTTPLDFSFIRENFKEFIIA